MKRYLNRVLRRLIKPKRRDEAKVIIDGENLFRTLAEIGKEDSDILEIINNLKGSLKTGEVISEIYFFATHKKGDREQEALSKRLRRNGIKVVLKPEKIIIPGMKRKSRIDPWILTEIMMTIITKITDRRNFKKIVLFSGDSDFEAPLKAAKKMGIESVVISHRNNLSKELVNLANRIIDLEKLLDASQ